MTTPGAAIKAQLDFHTRLFKNVINGISDDESNIRKTEQTNNIKWIAGHMLNTRLDTMSKLAGLEPDKSYGAQFARGAALDPGAAYPSIEEITAQWESVSPAIAAGFSMIPEEALASKAPFETPMTNLDDTIHGVVSFLLTHEACHIGQLSILRKMIGKEAMTFR